MGNDCAQKGTIISAICLCVCPCDLSTGTQIQKWQGGFQKNSKDSYVQVLYFQNISW